MLIVTIIAFALTIVFILLIRKTAKETNYPDYLFLTHPVMTFTGKIDSVEENAIWVSQNFTLFQNSTMTPVGNLGQQNFPPSPLPTPIKRTIRYKVLITDNSIISQPTTSINHLFASPSPPNQKKISIKDLAIRETVTIGTNSDLRLLSTNQFEAASIQLPPISNTVYGTITDIKDNQIFVKGNMVMPLPDALEKSQEKQYQVTITDTTEISRMNNWGKPEKLAFSDLKKDMQVNVYTAEDVVESQTLTALRIEPMLVLATSTPPIIQP